jgi:serine protease Do
MLFSRNLMIALMAVAVAGPAATAQERRPPDSQSGRVQMPRVGAVSMIGVRLGDVTAENMKTLKLSKAEGAVVESVNPNSPAATAELRERDVIVLFDGERVRSATHLTRLVSETPAGREVALTVVRDGRRTDLKITPQAGRGWFDPRFGGMVDIDQEQLREYAEQAGRAAREMSRNFPEMMEGMRGGVANRGRLGATVQEVTPDLAEYFGVKSGVLVASVVQGSAAAAAGLKAGDVITAVDGKAIATPSELIRALPTDEGSHDVTLTVVRDKKELTLKATLQPARTVVPRARPI